MLILKADQPVAGNALLIAVCKQSGARVQDCYQCGKCTAGCPVSSFMDLMPRQVMRAIELGQDDMVMHSSAIWLCASCQTCSARCPMEIDVAGVMDSLRHIALARGIGPAEKDVVLAHRLFLESMKRLGRAFEVGIVAGMNLGTLRPLANVPEVGVPLFLRGKLSLLPETGGRAEVRRIFARIKDRKQEAENEQ